MKALTTMMILMLLIQVSCDGNDEERCTNTGLLVDGGTEGVDEGVDVGGMHVVLGKEDSSWFTKGSCIEVLYDKEIISG